ncbi:cyclic nucleotide-binding domain-containing protein, partial [Myxococcota bacterium]|nr:cyclic nucleotide-binding domain-containing protein [Myxococcota bacterium]
MTDQSASNEVELLDHTLLFSNLHPQHKAQVFSTLVRKDYAAGQVIFNEGDPGDALYLIRSGKVSIYTTNKNLGVTFELATLSRGQVFGEMALLTEEKRSASVKTIEPTSCYILSLPVFNKIVQQLPAVSLGMAQTMAKRLAEVNKQKSIAFGSLSDYDFDMEVYSMVPAQVLERHKINPLVLEGTTLVVAMVDPKNTMGLDDVRRILRDVDLRPLAISGDDYERFLRDKVKKAQAAGGGLGKVRGVDHRQVKIFSMTSDGVDH